MEQRKLFKTLENAFKKFSSLENDREILSFILREIINNENIEITGGRIWELNDNKTAYVLIEQQGEIQKIKKGYTHRISDYPIFYEIGLNRSIISNESDKYLREKGIKIFAATGIGERYRVKGPGYKDRYVYQYLLAINAPEIHSGLLNTLNIISASVSSMLRARRIETKARAIEKDLAKAREIQRSILPEHEHSFGNYEIFGACIPDKIVGGDFFDYFSFGDEKDKMGIAIGDAASKGFSAAAQALYVSGALKMGSENELKMTSVIKKINNLVYKVFPYERFLTIFYMELFKDTKGLCLYVNAGHNPPFHLEHTTGNIESLESTGPVIGLAPNQEYTTESIYMKKNDLLVLYTDGIVEAANHKFEFFGEDRLKEIIEKHKNHAPKEIAENILEAVQIFSAKGKYSDDKTVVVIKRLT